MIARSRTVLVLAALALAPGLAQAEARFGIELQGGFSRYAMADVNDSLSSFNQQLGTGFGAIQDGPEFGIAIHVWAADPRLLLRAEFERLGASSEDSSVRFDMSANVYTVSASFFPPTEGTFHYGLGLGFGLAYTRGELSGPELSIEANGGGGVATRITAEALQYIGSTLALHAILGYRHAAVDMKFESADAAPIEVDYSGAFLRLGLVAERGPKAR